MPCKTANTVKPLSDHLKHIARALAVAAGLGAGGAQALTTTSVINLGPPPGTAFTRAGGLYTQIPTGTLPPGSILRAVSWDVSLWQGDPYLGDLTVYIADSDGTNPVLQVGSVGANVDGTAPYTAPIQLPWNAGGNYNYGATATTTLTASDGVPAIDLNTKTVFLENCYGNGGWAGTITLTYDVVALNVAVTTPANPYGYVTGTDIIAAAAVANGTPPYTVTFYTNSGAGNTVFTQAGQVTASSPPYQLDLGTLPDGVHNIYAAVADSNGGNATSTVNTFYTGVVFSAATSWTNTVSGTWWDYASWDSGYPVSSDATVINFTGSGTYTSTQNMGDGFVLNQVNFNNPVLTLDGNSLDFTSHAATLPRINQNSANAVTIKVPLNLTAMTSIGGSGSGAVTISSLISGSGGLTKDSAGTLTINNLNNTYSGGTVINAGKVTFQSGDTVTPFFGSGPVTINPNATLQVNRTYLTNPVTLNGAIVTGGNSFGSYLSGPVTLTGVTTFNFGTTGGFTIAGNISGTGGLTTVGTTQWSLSGTNSYTGPTTVQAGALSYDTATAVGPGALNISDGGAKVRLNYTGTTAIASLTLGGVAQTAPGTYGSSASGASIQNDTYFVGGGTVTVTAGTAYDTWATTTSGLSGADALPGADPDQDGLANALEFVLGGQPNPGLPGANSTDLLPKASSNPAGDMIFTFQRADISVGAATVTFQWSSDLTFPALNDVVVPSAAGTTTINGVEVAVTDGSPNDTIVITVPAAKAAGNKLFGRLQVSVP